MTLLCYGYRNRPHILFFQAFINRCTVTSETIYAFHCEGLNLPKNPEIRFSYIVLSISIENMGNLCSLPLPVMEPRDLVSVSRPFFRVSVSNVSGLGLEGTRSQALSLETLHELFFMESCRKQLLGKRIYEVIV